MVLKDLPMYKTSDKDSLKKKINYLFLYNFKV